MQQKLSNILTAVHNGMQSTSESNRASSTTLCIPTKDTSCPSCRSDVVAIKQLYPEVAQLMTAYAPDKVTTTMCVTDLSRIYDGRSPTLRLMREAYGLTEAVSWVKIQLLALSRFANVSEGLTEENVNILAHLILGNYDYLRLSEFMYFIGRVMMGKYGYFYGAVDPMRIMSFLNQFLSERLADISQLEKVKEEEARQHRFEKMRREAVSWEEYKRKRPSPGPSLKRAGSRM